MLVVINEMGSASGRLCVYHGPACAGDGPSCVTTTTAVATTLVPGVKVRKPRKRDVAIANEMLAGHGAPVVTEDERNELARAVTRSRRPERRKR